MAFPRLAQDGSKCEFGRLLLGTLGLGFQLDLEALQGGFHTWIWVKSLGRSQKILNMGQGFGV